MIFLLLSTDIYYIWFILFLECQIIRRLTNLWLQWLISPPFLRSASSNLSLPALVTTSYHWLCLPNVVGFWQNMVWSLGLVCNALKIHSSLNIRPFLKVVPFWLLKEECQEGYWVFRWTIRVFCSHKAMADLVQAVMSMGLFCFSFVDALSN